MVLLSLNPSIFMIFCVTRTCFSVGTPIDCSSIKPQTEEEAETLAASFDSTRYRQVVGSLQYLSITHPDLSFTVSKAA